MLDEHRHLAVGSLWVVCSGPVRLQRFTVVDVVLAQQTSIKKNVEAVRLCSSLTL